MDLVNPSTKLANQVDNEIIISEENSRNRHLPVVEDLSYTVEEMLVKIEKWYLKMNLLYKD